MNGVDVLDQHLSYYSFNRKTVKWWKRAATHLLHVAKVQALILYNKNEDVKLSQLDFTLELVARMTNKTIGVDSVETEAPRTPSTPLTSGRLSHRDNPHQIASFPHKKKESLCLLQGNSWHEKKVQQKEAYEVHVQRMCCSSVC